MNRVPDVHPGSVTHAIPDSMHLNACGSQVGRVEACRACAHRHDDGIARDLEGGPVFGLALDVISGDLGDGRLQALCHTKLGEFFHERWQNGDALPRSHRTEEFHDGDVAALSG